MPCPPLRFGRRARESLTAEASNIHISNVWDSRGRRTSSLGVKRRLVDDFFIPLTKQSGI